MNILVKQKVCMSGMKIGYAEALKAAYKKYLKENYPEAKSVEVNITEGDTDYLQVVASGYRDIETILISNALQTVDNYTFQNYICFSDIAGQCTGGLKGAIK